MAPREGERTMSDYVKSWWTVEGYRWMCRCCASPADAWGIYKLRCPTCDAEAPDGTA